MKKRFIAGMVAAILTMGSMSLPVFARYDVEPSNYVFVQTTDLQAFVDNEQEKVVLTWPAVDKDGNLIKANPLKAEGQVQSNGNPTRGWTTPTNGMIIAYDGWLPDGTHNKVSNDNKSNHNVVMGVVDNPPVGNILLGDVNCDGNVKADDSALALQYVLNKNLANLSEQGLKNAKVTMGDGDISSADSAAILQKTLSNGFIFEVEGNSSASGDLYPIVVKDPKTGEVIKNAYVDPTVVATSLATAYQIQYSLDGVTWTEDHIASTFNHGKKLSRVQEDGTVKDDNKNSFFLEDQITEPLTNNLKPETEYFIRVNAFDASAPATKNTPFKTFETKITTPAVAELTPAFPTVEGGGTYSQGGRGTAQQQGDVYVVTNLTDSVTDPQPGSFRYGLERRDRADGNKLYPRTIVFAVGGTINVDPEANKNSRRFNITDNTTIAGQSAPGDGITIAGASMKFTGKNIVVRYTKFRLGSGYNLDGATAKGENIVVDHCTFSWGVDEVFTAKEIINSSIQYNIIDSGLSVVDKDGVNNIEAEIGADSAKHGMGSILNGYETSYTHNLWSHNGTRNPRFEGGFEYNGVRYENKLDFSNNVVYNWGHNSGYGGERGKGLVNFENNYFKTGPNTLEKCKNTLFDCDGSVSTKSSYYFGGNVMHDNAEVTADNKLGFRDLASVAIQLNEKVEMKTPYTPETAEEAYNNVLNRVGASLNRDEYDNRLIQQVKNGTGYFVNDQYEAGGFSNKTYKSTLTDTDMDGMPDAWEDTHGLDKTNSNDATLIITEDNQYKGYTNLEVYLNDIVGDWDKTNKSVIADKALNITSVKDSSGTDIDISVNADLFMGQTYTITCDTTEKFDVYLNERIVGSGENGTATFTPDKTGNANLMVKTDKIFSDRVRTTIIPATATANLDGFTSIEIGETRAKGADFYDPSTNTLITEGNGYYGRTGNASIGTESLHYNFKEMTGDVTITAKIYNWAKIDYFQFSGLMLRSDLTNTSETYGAGMTYLKDEDYSGIKGVNGSERFEGRNIVATYRKKAEPVNAVFDKYFLGVPQAVYGQPQIGGWAKIEKKGQTVTAYASNDGQEWYQLYQFETTLPETYYVGFATSSAQDAHEMVTYNKSLITDISIENSAK